MKFKYREGFSPENYRIPSRILETKSPHGTIDEEYLRKTIEAYYSFFQPQKPAVADKSHAEQYPGPGTASGRFNLFTR